MSSVDEYLVARTMCQEDANHSEDLSIWGAPCRYHRDQGSMQAQRIRVAQRSLEATRSARR